MDARQRHVLQNSQRFAEQRSKGAIPGRNESGNGSSSACPRMLTVQTVGIWTLLQLPWQTRCFLPAAWLQGDPMQQNVSCIGFSGFTLVANVLFNSSSDVCSQGNFRVQDTVISIPSRFSPHPRSRRFGGVASGAERHLQCSNLFMSFSVLRPHMILHEFAAPKSIRMASFEFAPIQFAFVGHMVYQILMWLCCAP